VVEEVPLASGHDALCAFTAHILQNVYGVLHPGKIRASRYLASSGIAKFNRFAPDVALDTALEVRGLTVQRPERYYGNSFD
jgi:hypothetical protein